MSSHYVIPKKTAPSPEPEEVEELALSEDEMEGPNLFVKRKHQHMSSLRCYAKIRSRRNGQPTVAECNELGKLTNTLQLTDRLRLHLL